MAGRNLVVVSFLKHWPLAHEGVEVMTARDYLAQRSGETETGRVRVFNLCHSYAYQTLGYYVSLLAEARGHRVFPSPQTLRDFRAVAVVRSFAEDIDSLIQQSLKSIENDEHTLRVIFSETTAPSLQKLGKQLYRLFPAPFLQASFVRRKQKWVLDGLGAVPLTALKDDERALLGTHAPSYLVKQAAPRPYKQRFDYDLAIVLNPKEIDPPSDRLADLALPCVLKLPDGAFSRGVKKAESHEEAQAFLKEMLKESDLVLAQAFVPSEYDWRIGVLENAPLYACQYHMAKGHWQIYNWGAAKPADRTGRADTIPVSDVPSVVLDVALKAARLMGNGLYGVDIKQFGASAVVIEVNDNPSIESGIEDRVMGMELYRRLAESFRARIEALRRRK